ncbi:hypothetical protein BJY00DRAFT_324111 [Aspergillus carlsbadensis]|nr:hypothetical protein BJY00DRAFT_324111 [Aspergillus carlsbadensis]
MMFTIDILTVLLLAWFVLAHDFDYIVVGGGTTGIPLAVRLAEHWNVALVEAGGRYEKRYPLAKTPGANVLPVGSDPETSSPIDWGFVTEPFPGANGRRLHVAQGKCLGGTPTEESMVVWLLLTDDLSYGWVNVLPFYQRSVEFTPPNTETRFENANVLYNAAAFLPSGGPLQVTYPNYAQSFSTWLEDGFEEVGIPQAVDFNSGKLEGYQYCSSTIRPSNQHRSSFKSSFLAQPVPSLTVYTDTLAKRVIFDEDLNAVQVEVNHREFERNLTASREIIISAGAFHSPQLLMVPGIGPRQHLEDHGIEVLVERPAVGQDMWDHPVFGPSYRVNVETLTRLANSPTYFASQYLRWATKQLGPFKNSVSDLLAWEKIPDELRRVFSPETLQALSQFPDDWPEVEYISAPGFLGNISNLKADQPDDGCQYASIIGVLVAPTSRGTVTLRTADTADLPLINLNLLDTKSDQEVVMAMFKRMREILASQAMEPVVIGDEYFPGSHIQTDEEILEYIRENVMTLWHPSGTCRTGRIQDRAVVDSRARVYGVNRLRVVDASAFAILPPGHPQSTCYMLAEKIADDIIQNGAGVGEDARADL